VQLAGAARAGVSEVRVTYPRECLVTDRWMRAVLRLRQWAPTFMNPPAASRSVGGIVGRWAPVVGFGTFTDDVRGNWLVCWLL
jgi:hypothetical protein